MARIDTTNIDTMYLDICDSSIEQSANYVNSRLTELIVNTPKNNNWFILDYPSPDIIRAIYQSNDPKNSNFNKNKAKVDNWFEFVWIDVKYFVSKAPFETVFDVFEYIFRRNNNSNRVTCLQRGLKNDKVTINNKRIKSSKSQWYIKKNNKYFNIVSAYDKKCLTYNNELSINECNSNNIYIDFTVKNRKFCSC